MSSVNIRFFLDRGETYTDENYERETCTKLVLHSRSQCTIIYPREYEPFVQLWTVRFTRRYSRAKALETPGKIDAKPTEFTSRKNFVRVQRFLHTPSDILSTLYIFNPKFTLGIENRTFIAIELIFFFFFQTEFRSVKRNDRLSASTRYLRPKFYFR